VTDSLPPPSIGGEDLEVVDGLRGARRMLAVGGGRGGVGKSLVAQNLAIYLAQLGKNVTLVDLDPTGSNMHTQFGIPAHTFPPPIDGAIDELVKALVPTSVPGLSILPGPHDAIEPQEKACAVLEKEYGTPHPQLALCLGNLAALYSTLGEHERSLEQKRRALEMFERVPGHPNHVGMARRNMVRSLPELGRLPEAKSELEKAAALSQRAADEITIILLRGELHRREGKLTDALADLLLGVEKTRSLEPSRQIEPLLALAETNLAGGKWADATTNASRASEIARTVHGETSCRLATPLRTQADALLGSGDTAAALPLAEKALALVRGAQIDPLARARAELAVARSLPSSERDRARHLAESAREIAKKDPRDPKLTERIDAWLASSER